VEYFLKRTSKKLFKKIQSLGEIIGLPNVEHPLQFQDVMLGRYICRRNPLPCNAAGECFTINDYVEVADESSTVARNLFDKAYPYSRSKSLIEAFTLLKHLKNATVTARNKAQGRKIFKILSGHDITIEPLMHTLAIKHLIPPHYSSRLVFEVTIFIELTNIKSKYF
jgi:hypothetical protein